MSRLKPPAIWFSCLGIALLVCSCTGTRPIDGAIPVASPLIQVAPSLQAKWTTLSHSHPGQVYQIDPAQSKVRIYAYRAGKLARLGHNHVLSAPHFQAYFYAADKEGANGHFELQFALADLEIDNPAGRKNAGPGFQSQVSQAAIDGTREHMLGEDNFQASRFPQVWIRSVKIAGETPKFVATVDMEMHGTTRQLVIPLNAQISADTLVVQGAFAIRQTDFGVKPYSVMGGVLAVEDEVSIEFELKGRPLKN